MDDAIFDVSVPITGGDQKKTIGVMRLIIRRDVFFNPILQIRVGKTGHGMLLNTLGTPLVCPVLPPQKHLIQPELLQHLSTSRPIWKVVPDSLGENHWYTLIRRDPGETCAPIYDLLLQVGLIGFGLVLILSSLGVVVSKRITSPIFFLKEESDKLRRDMSSSLPSGGHVESSSKEVLLEIRSEDEIEDLAKTFYAIRATLEESLRTVKLQQEELIRREKLASVVGQLLAALAHDLKNPLGIIRSSAQVILDQNQPRTVKEEVARYIIEEVDRLKHQIVDFLRYARQKPPVPQVIAPESLVQSALDEWWAQEKPNHITVRTQFGSDLPDLVVDPEQVKEALVNLLMNAREAMQDGGELTIEIRTGEHEYIEVEITDTGCGIPSSTLARIFDPFFTTKEYGIGLGLTNVKRLIEDNGATIVVSSQEGRGTQFVLFLPTTVQSQIGEKVLQ
jgi:signal transduction histidine kinase